MSAEAEAGETAGPDGLENWVVVEEREAEYEEMQAYCEMRRLLPLYARALRNFLEFDKAALDDVDRVIKWLPSAGHMLDGRYAEDTRESIAAAAANGKPAWLQRPWVWRYNGAYCAFSETKVISRSWLLVTLANAMQTLEDVFTALPEGQPQNPGLTYAQRQQPKLTYDRLQVEYKIWKALAEAGVAKPSIGWHRLREEYGPRHAGRPKKSGIQHKLDALQRVGEWEGGRTEAGSFGDYWYGRDKKQIEELLVEVARLKKKCGEGAVETGEKTQQPAVAVPKPAVEKAAVTPEIVKAWDGHTVDLPGGQYTYSYEVRKCAATDPDGEYQLWCNGDYKRNYTEDMKREAAEESAKAEEKRLKDLQFLAKAHERAEKQRTEKAEKKAREEAEAERLRNRTAAEKLVKLRDDMQKDAQADYFHGNAHVPNPKKVQEKAVLIAQVEAEEREKKRVAAQASVEQGFEVVYEEWVDVDSRNGNMKMQVREYVDGGANGKYQRWVGHILSERNMPEADVRRDYPQFFVGKPGATTPAQQTPVVHGETVYTGTEWRESGNGFAGSHNYQIKVYECTGGYEQWADDVFEVFMEESTLKQKYPFLPIFNTNKPMSDRERQAWGEELAEDERRRQRDREYGSPEQYKL